MNIVSGRLTSRVGALVFCILAQASVWAADCVPPPAGLVSWWPAEGTPSDVFGTNRDSGTVPYAPGMVGQCFSFNGVNQFILVTNSPSLNPATALSLEGWVNIAVVPALDVVSILTKESTFGTVEYQLCVKNSGGTLSFYALIALPSGYVLAQGASAVQTNTWYHLAATYDGSSLKLYLNGVVDASASATGPLLTGTEPMTIGCQRGSWFFNGKVDELSLYARALSPAEVLAISTAGAAGKCSTPVPPSIYAQPASQTAYEGDSVTLSVDAGGTAPLVYQWEKNGAAVSGATDASLHFGAVGLSDTGDYRVIVTNTIGSVTSSVATLTVTARPPCAQPASSIAGWWRADGNASDALGGIGGTLMNGAGFAPGEVGQAFAFDGVSQYVRIPDYGPLDPTAALTYEAWVNVTKAPTINVVSILTKEGSGSVQYQLLLQNQGGLAFRGLMRVSSGYIVVTGSTPVQTGQWYHVAITYDGSALRLYVNGNLDAVAAGSGSVITGTGDLTIGSQGPAYFFAGKVDELSVYSAALSPADIQAIYRSGSGGKCAATVPPFIFRQPGKLVVTQGQTATFSAGVSGSQPFLYHWQFNGGELTGATNSFLVLTNVQMNQAGAYSFVVSNEVGYAVSSNAALTVNFPPATVRVVNTSAEGGRPIAVPIVLASNGNENALGFSLGFLPSRLTFNSVSLGSSATGAALFVNTNSLATGMVGIALSLPAGNTFAPGTQELVVVNFTTAVLTAPANTTISFGDTPTRRQLVDAQAGLLAANYAVGTVSIAKAMFEADVSPRPNGDGAVTITDWVLIGRFAAALEPPQNPSEFQRADCAPRGTQGDGAITVADWVQGGRYAAGLDPLEIAAGPTSGPGPSGIVVAKDSGRLLRVSQNAVIQGQTGTVGVYLDSQGDENAVGASLSFDPAVLSYVSVAAGADAQGATLNLNTLQAGSGRVAFALALQTGTHFAAGTRELLLLTLKASPSAAGSYPISVTDQPIHREVVDAAASVLGCTYSNGSFGVYSPPSLRIESSPTNVALYWPLYATNFVLQESEALGAWTNIAVNPEMANGEWRMTLPQAPAARFYRLKNGP